MGSLRILIVDDHEAVLRGVRSLLSSRADWLVCGEAKDGLEAIEKAKSLRPDLVLMDLSMPRMDGAQATRIIRREIPGTQVIIVTQNDPIVAARQAAEADASAFVAKSDLSRGLLPAIDRVIAARNGASINRGPESQPKSDSIDGKQKEPEAALQAKLLDLSFIAVMLRDEADRITYWNQGAEQLYGWTREEALGRVTDTLFRTEFPEPLASIREHLRREGRWQGELTHICKNGRRVTVLSRWALTRDPETNVESIMEANIDITQAKDADRASSLLAAIVGSSDDAIVSKRLDGIITSWNKAAERMFGYTAEEAIGQHITLIIPEDRLDEEVNILRRLRRGERIDHFETIRRRKDGTLLDLSLTISPVKDGAGRIIGASKVARDITERKQAEDRERRITAEAVAATAKFRAVFEQTTVFAGIMQLDGTVIDANRLCLDACGYRLEDVLGKPLWECGWWRNSKEAQDKIRAATPKAAAGIPYREILNYCCADDTERVVDFALYPIRDHQDRILFLHSTGVDITDLKRAEENYRALAETLDAEVRARTDEVVQQSEQLRELSNRLLRTQDDERRHIARELHDSAGQIIAALGMNLGSLSQFAAENPGLAKTIDDSQALVEQLSKEIRTTSYLLHPPLLDENGLPEPIRWYVHGLMQRSGLTIDLNLAEDFGRLPHEMELALFRIVQECLTNIHRHSGSKTATLRLFRSDSGVGLEVQDEGKGIPAEKLDAIHAQHSGVGITGMRERVRHFKGKMDIHSNASGTKILVMLPFSAPDSSQHTHHEQPSRIVA